MQTSSTPKNIRVLLVEDSQAIAMRIKGFLASVKWTKFTVEYVEDLASAMRLMSDKSRFDVILLDLGLPDSHGLDTFVRLHELAPDVPTVVFTGVDDEEVAFKAPVMIGDTITVESEVTEKIEERRRLIITSTWTNQDGKVVIIGKGEHLLPRSG